MSAPDESPGFLKTWLLPAALAMAVVLPLRSAIADWNDVPSGSMWPTLVEGDRIFVEKLAYGLRLPFTHTWLASWEGPDRGEIVTFASPKDGTRLVKRVVGLPGDRIAVAGGVLYVNGAPVEFSAAETDTSRHVAGRPVRMLVGEEALPGHPHAVARTEGHGSRDFPETIVPDGHYYMLGDNRDQSFDSRYLGTVPRDALYGRVRWVALSVDPERYYAPRFERWGSALR